jgi:hypothetical protein
MISPRFGAIALLLPLFGAQGCQTDAACRADPSCKEIGVCTAKKLLWCEVDNDADCRASNACRHSGRCAARPVKGARYEDCMPATEFDCLQSEDCKLHGRCAVETDTHTAISRCVEPPSQRARR